MEVGSVGCADGNCFVIGRWQCFNNLGGMSFGFIGDILVLALVFASTVINNLGQL